MVCEKFVGCNGNESLQIDCYSWVEATGGQQCDGETGRKGTSRVPIRCWNLSVHDRATLRHRLQHEGNHERGSWTDHSLKDQVTANRALPQRTSAMCTESPLGGKLDDVIHVTVDADWAGDPKTRCSTSEGVLAIGPCFTVRHWSVTQATVSLSSAESEAKAITKGCGEALYVKHLMEHQMARTFKIEVWTDSSSAKAIIQRLGPGRRAKHLEVQTMWVQHLNKLGLISMNKLEYAGKRGRHDDKTFATRVVDKLAGIMGYSFPGEETAKFHGKSADLR